MGAHAFSLHWLFLGSTGSGCMGCNSCSLRPLGHGFSGCATYVRCSTWHVNLPDQRVKLSPLHWWANSYPLYHQKPSLYFLFYFFLCFPMPPIDTTISSIMLIEVGGGHCFISDLKGKCSAAFPAFKYAVGFCSYLYQLKKFCSISSLLRLPLRCNNNLDFYGP